MAWDEAQTMATDVEVSFLTSKAPTGTAPAHRDRRQTISHEDGQRKTPAPPLSYPPTQKQYRIAEPKR